MVSGCLQEGILSVKASSRPSAILWPKLLQRIVKNVKTEWPCKKEARSRKPKANPNPLNTEPKNPKLTLNPKR